GRHGRGAREVSGRRGHGVAGGAAGGGPGVRPLRTVHREGDRARPGPAPGRDRPLLSSDKADPRQPLGQKSSTIPKITITRASNETLVSYSSTESDEQRTIREQAECGPYQRHRNPSTIAAYNLHSQE
ncbi:spermatogenesis-associated protein 33, partial [Oryctolagus cuniculus]|uniref:spermatogenesis-associated protein 33 n=1 Tax=Oryctolagus cuniculus TaxID=9986 RepID=UPI003879B54E